MKFVIVMIIFILLVYMVIGYTLYDTSISSNSSFEDEPKKGINYLEFSDRCKFGLSMKDRVSRSQSVGKDIIIVRLGETKDRLTTDCYGTFVFENNYLVSVSR